MSNNNFILLLFILIALIGCVSDDEYKKPSLTGVFLDEWTYRVNPLDESNFDIAEFRLWIPNPNNIENIKAVLVLLKHSNGNALGLVDEPFWKTYANENNLALLGVHFENGIEGSTRAFYTDAAAGSGDALLFAIQAITEKHEISKLNNLPLLLRGYSAGGVFSYQFTSYLPNRVIAYANIRGGSLFPVVNDNIDVPGLMLIGEKDLEYRSTNMISLVLENRFQDGLLSYAIEPNAEHHSSLVASDELIKTFFTEAVSEISNKNHILNKLDVTTGLFGDHSSLKYYNFTNYPNEIQKASWLINEKFAEKWVNYQSK